MTDVADRERAGSSPRGAALAGRRVALPETRELDRLAVLIEEQGAMAVRCPLVAILDAPEPGPVDAFLRQLAAGALDDLVLLTGEGLRRLMTRAAAIGLGPQVTAALARVRKITRGPKPARALHELALATDVPARLPTTAGVIETLSALPLRGRRVGVQLYGSDPNDALVSFLARAGATVISVAPYIYAPASDTDRVLGLVAALRAGGLDAIAFTSASQVHRLFAVAESHGLGHELRAALARTLVAAVGPVASAALETRGVSPQIALGQPFVMKRLVGAVAAALASAPLRRLRGRRVALPEHRELDRLALMLEAEGATAVRCPLMAIFDAADPAPVDEWLRALVAGRFADVVFLTGEGVQRLHQAAERIGLGEAMVAALARIRKIVRGPKPARALHQLGLSVELAASPPTSQGVMDCLRGQVLTGRAVGLQLYGDDPGADLRAFLEARGATVHPVAPYRYAPASDDDRVDVVVDEIAAGGIDAIAFTTALQIDRLFQVAERRGKTAALQSGLTAMHVAAVGPVVAEALARRQVRVDALPTRQLFMRRLTEAMAENLGPKAL